MSLEIGDLVTRFSYNEDILFRITAIQKDGNYELKGEDLRLVADAPYEDLNKIDDDERAKREKEERKKEEQTYHLFRQGCRLLREKNEYEMSSSYSTSTPLYFEMRGRVLHMDGDGSYLQKCKLMYERLGIPVYGAHMKETDMQHQVSSLLEMVQPDILVITGHDAYTSARGEHNDPKAYRHSRAFAQTVREARKVVPHLDNLIIFAGACQSYFEALIRAGANFASSPARVNIHALDPVYIAAKVSMTPFMNRVELYDILRNTLTGDDGLGGIDTKGVLRRGLPLRDETEM
ncbi:spore coat assembly protein [Geomicrobium halophilum]|uniref:Spore coat assembly protein n=1 Tax=Geomicrobium halophilum TaxID=549000 RepID=A0A841Q2U4_9BACL|nr:sporulation peptidase YabG [Geomicrobium halophilum]MBB6451518.1 spore coat assembly protein [Geomicrobium halophilum]